MSHHRPNEQKRGDTIAATPPWSKQQENILVDKITELNRAVNNANAELRECKAQMQQHINIQHEIQSFYQNQVKYMAYLKESREKELLDKIAHLQEPPVDVELTLLHQIRSIKLDLATTRNDAVQLSRTIHKEIETAAIQIKKGIGEALSGSDIVLYQQIEFIQEKYKRELELRKRLQNELIEERGNICVFGRVRPFIPLDQSKETNLQVLLDENIIIVQTKQIKTRQFELDKIFSMNASQSRVFEDIKPLLSSLLDGYNVCILAYGQTGSGKTYTMEGTSQEQGMIPRALAELFDRMQEKGQTHQFRISMSMVEIYNNEVRDLLKNDKRPLEAFDSGEGGLQIKGATTVQISNMEQVKRYIKRGSSNRSEASTLMNNHSSRSHSIVTIEVETIQTQSSKTIMGFSMGGTKAKLRLVDLAGSECVGMSGVTGEQAKETSYVNRSLAALGDVMQALSQKKTHVPYRNSRLTHLLQDSLGGDAKMLVLICVSPVASCSTETAHAVSFGSRIRLVTLKKKV